MAMTSIVPGGNSTMSSKISTKDQSLTKVAIPGRNPATKSGTYKGRKFVEVSHSASADLDVGGSKRNRKPNVDVGDLDKLLENDAAALQNMRKDIKNAQTAEMDKARTNLSAIRKEYDTLSTHNAKHAHKIAELRDKKIILEGLVEAQQHGREKYMGLIDAISEELREVEENIEAEERTKNMMSFMRNRLDSEIMDCKIKSHSLTATWNQLKAEFNGLESTLRLSRLELSSEERHMESLLKTVKSRSEQRQAKMQELQGMVQEGENSIARVKMSMEGVLEGSLDINEAAVNEVQDQANMTKDRANKSSPGSNDPDATAGAAIDLTGQQISEVIERYSTQQSRIERLNHVQKDLKEQLNAQRAKRVKMELLLEKSQQKLQLLASNRQVYQEVEMKDAALSTARKEGDDCREREYRLRKSIEGLRRAVPRFLQKVNKDLIPDGGGPVTVDQLPDVVHKLDDEVNKLIRQIGERMLKDATPEDLSSMTASVQEYSAMQSSDNQSETSRLHKLPGYNRLQKQLFINLMSATPDSSDKNVRVKPELPGPQTDVRGTEKEGENSAGGTRKERGATANGAVHATGSSDYIDRNTVKNISKLIVGKTSASNTKTGQHRGKKQERRR